MSIEDREITRDAHPITPARGFETMTQDLEELRRLDREAREAYLILDEKRYNEYREWELAASKQMRAVLDERYGERLMQLEKARDEAARLLAEAEAEAGKANLVNYPSGIVAEWGYARYAYRRGVKVLTGRRGRFEVCTPQTQFAGNISTYRQPAPGTIFIRILKKDGTPSLAFETARWGGDLVPAWLPEGQKPKTEEVA